MMLKLVLPYLNEFLSKLKALMVPCWYLKVGNPFMELNFISIQEWRSSYGVYITFMFIKLYCEYPLFANGEIVLIFQYIIIVKFITE
jgi:hypothetical protein